jgi:topoisomerase-4 subunit B
MQLKETTMNPATRTLLQVKLPDPDEKERTRETARLVEGLMGKKPEKRFEYIQENAQFVRDLDV